MYNLKQLIMKKAAKLLLGLGLLLGFSQISLAHHNPRGYESDVKIDRIQVNKMRVLQREFKFELNHNHFRDARYIKYDIIELLQKDIRFQKKKIRDLKTTISNHDHPYYRKSNNKSKGKRYNNDEYYDDNYGHNDSHINIHEAKKELRLLRRQLDDKRDLLYNLERSSYNNPRELRRDLRSIKAIIKNMKADVDLHYNLNLDSPYYRKAR